MELVQILALIRGTIQLGTTATKALADLRSSGQLTEAEYNEFKDSMDDTDKAWLAQLERLGEG